MVALFRGGFDLDVRSHDGRNFLLLMNKDIMTDTGVMYRMPRGSISDGASIPKFLWSLGLAPFGPYWPPTFAHDCAYKGSLLIYQDGQWVEAMLPRDVCDDLLMALMVSVAVEQQIRDVVYRGVRTCGLVSFRDDRVSVSCL